MLEPDCTPVVSRRSYEASQHSSMNRQGPITFTVKGDLYQGELTLLITPTSDINVKYIDIYVN